MYTKMRVVENTFTNKPISIFAKSLHSPACAQNKVKEFRASWKHFLFQLLFVLVVVLVADCCCCIRLLIDNNQLLWSGAVRCYETAAHTHTTTKSLARRESQTTPTLQLRAYFHFFWWMKLKTTCCFCHFYYKHCCSFSTIKQHFLLLF